MALIKALCRLLPAVFGVFAVAAVVATTQTDAPSTEVKTASKHWCDGVDREDHFD
jgi:hypothetical protein